MFKNRLSRSLVFNLRENKKIYIKYCEQIEYSGTPITGHFGQISRWLYIEATKKGFMDFDASITGRPVIGEPLYSTQCSDVCPIIWFIGIR